MVVTVFRYDGEHVSSHDFHGLARVLVFQIPVCDPLEIICASYVTSNIKSKL